MCLLQPPSLSVSQSVCSALSEHCTHLSWSSLFILSPLLGESFLSLSLQSAIADKGTTSAVLLADFLVFPLVLPPALYSTQILSLPLKMSYLKIVCRTREEAKGAEVRLLESGLSVNCKTGDIEQNAFRKKVALLKYFDFLCNPFIVVMIKSKYHSTEMGVIKKGLPTCWHWCTQSADVCVCSLQVLMAMIMVTIILRS